MSRAAIFINNAIAAALLQVVTVIVGFIIPRIMLSVYGSEINGLVTSISQFIGYFNLVEAGLASSAVYSLYKPLAEKDDKGINAILSASRHFYNQSGYIFVSLVLGLAIIYPVFIKSASVNIIETGILVLIIGCSGALEFFTMAKYRVLLTAAQKIYVLSIASICSIIVSTIIIAVLAHYRVNIAVVRAVALCAVFLRSFILYFYVKQTYKNIDYHTEPDKNALNKRWDALYLQILGSINTGAPIIIATIFLSLKTVSVYAIYNVVLGGISGIFSVAINGLFPSFGDIITRKEQNILQIAYQEFELIYYMLINLVYACSFILIMPFIKLYTRGITDINYNVPLIGTLFVINGLMYNLKTPQGMLVISAGLFKETKIQTSIQGLIGVVGGIIFVQFWGLAGLLFGSILSNLYRDIDLLFFIPQHVTKLKVKQSFYRIVRIIVCFGIAVAPFQFITIEATSYMAWVKQAVLISLYVFFVVFLINIISDRKIFISAIRRFFMTISKIARVNFGSI
jgi:hypothetical protein